MTSQPEEQMIALQILPNISRSKGNKTMIFNQLTEYNMRNVFLEKSNTKYDGETIPRPFFKNQNWEYLWINILKFDAVWFYFMPSWGLSKYIEIKMQILAFTSYKAFLINKGL